MMCVVLPKRGSAQSPDQNEAESETRRAYHCPPFDGRELSSQGEPLQDPNRSST